MTSTSPSSLPFSLTTPLYYVNDLPHVGSAYTTIAADVIARFQRIQGRSTLLVTGVDEHGQKIQRTAEALGRSPQAHCDQVVTSFTYLWERLGIVPDRFIRTTDSRHTAIVKEFFQRVWDQGDIYLGQQKGWYCVACEEFKEERDLIEGRSPSSSPSEKAEKATEKYCPIHTNKAVEWRDEQNYFFRLSHYQSKLEALYEAHPEFIQPDIRRNEVLSFVSQGLQDFSISRVNLDWGIPVPADSTHTLYVWFDALLGYITALLDAGDEPTLENALARWYPFNLHLIGKDILRFHAVYWPAMLMSAGLPLPNRVFGHGFLTKDGQKMGKSLGNVLDPVALVDRYGSDAVRYYFLKEIEFGRDGDFNEVRFVNILNADLANDLGNLLNRTLKMVLKYCGTRVPKISEEALLSDNVLAALGQNLGDRVAQAYEALAFSEACEAILTLARTGNKFIDEQAPWTLYKQGKTAQVEAILYTVLEAVRLAAYLLAPITPDLSTAVYRQLGFDFGFNTLELGKYLPPFDKHSTWGRLRPGQLLGEPSPVFQRLEAADTPLS